MLTKPRVPLLRDGLGLGWGFSACSNRLVRLFHSSRRVYLAESGRLIHCVYLEHDLPFVFVLTPLLATKAL